MQGFHNTNPSRLPQYQTVQKDETNKRQTALLRSILALLPQIWKAG